jgi:hypothetical protein
MITNWTCPWLSIRTPRGQAVAPDTGWGCSSRGQQPGHGVGAGPHGLGLVTAERYISRRGC